MEIDKSDICFIRAKLKQDYVFDAYVNMGFKTLVPYKGNSIVSRAFREICFRSGLSKERWFNPEIKCIKQNTIIIMDPLIVPELIIFLRNLYPDKRIILFYENRANRTIDPDCIIDPSIIKATYDDEDSKNYGMHLVRGGYLDIYRLTNVPKDRYDVVFVGRDKGRGDSLLELEKDLQSMGLKTYFHICGDRRFINKHKKYYKPVLSYGAYLDLISHSKSLINIMPEGQTSTTTRDYEVLFNGIKGITNNKGIKNYDFYDNSRFFVLGDDDLKDLPAFLNAPFASVPGEILEEYGFERFMTDLLSICI